MSSTGPIIMIVPSPHNGPLQELQFCIQSCSFSGDWTWENIGILHIEGKETHWTPLEKFKPMLANLITTKEVCYQHPLGTKEPYFNAKWQIKEFAEKIISGDLKVDNIYPQGFSDAKILIKPVFVI